MNYEQCVHKPDLRASTGEYEPGFVVDTLRMAFAAIAVQSPCYSHFS